MTQDSPPQSRPFRRWMGRFAFVYLIVTFVVVVWFWMAADEHWIATLLLFGPRWVALTPLALLLPLILLTRSWLGLLACLVATVMIAGPFMGGVVNVSPALEPAKPGGVLRVMTFNADNRDCDRKRFQAFIDAHQPDIIGLQDANRILDADMPVVYRLVSVSNGLKIALKESVSLAGVPRDVFFGPARGAAKFTVVLPEGEREIAVLHLPTPRPGLEEVLARRLNAVEKLQAVIQDRDRSSSQARKWIGDCQLVIGDFNQPAESVVYRRDWGRYRNAFSDTGLGWGWTMHTDHAAVRIDHILYAAPWTCRASLVGPDLGSAHRPVLADLAP
jgi:vancomycin resistance protein VanJ